MCIASWRFFLPRRWEVDGSPVQSLRAIARQLQLGVWMKKTNPPQNGVVEGLVTFLDNDTSIFHHTPSGVGIYFDINPELRLSR